MGKLKTTLNYMITAILGIILYLTRTTDGTISPIRALLCATYSFYILVTIANICMKEAQKKLKA